VKILNPTETTLWFSIAPWW